MGFYQTQSCVSRPVRAASPVRAKTADTPVFRNDQLENRLIEAETLTNLPSTVPRVKLEFTYDYMSRRVGKTVYNWASNDWSLVETRGFVYDGWNLVSEKINNQQSTITNSYVWGLDLSGTLQSAGGIGGLLSARLGTNNACYTFDGNGNVSELIADSGSIAAHYEYSPFGETIVATGPLAKENKFRFSTKPMDDEIEWYNFGRRPYAPGMSRFTTKDPLGERGGLNLYLFVGNNSINRSDALGLLSWNDVVGMFQKTKDAIEAAEKCMDSVRAGFKRRDQGYGDKLNHCLSSCEISQDCGQGIATALGYLKEDRDLITGGLEWLIDLGVPKSWEDWIHEHIQGGNFDESVADFVANFAGCECKNDPAGCECCCKKLYK